MTTTVKTRGIVLCGLFSALIAIGAFLQVPVPFMDYFTLQFLFVTLAGMLLRLPAGEPCRGGLCGRRAGRYPGVARRAAASSTSSAELWLPARVHRRRVAHRTDLRADRRGTVRAVFAAAFAGMAVTYAVGFLYKFLILNYYLGQTTPFAVVLLSAFPLDLPGDAVLCVVASGLAGRLRAALGKEHLL